MNPILKYPGAKWRLSEWIISHMPPHTGYVEPFFGSGAVFFNKAPAKTEIINDLNGDIVRLFRVIRSTPDQLCRAIRWTPWARGELEYCRSSQPVNDDIEMARRFLVRYWQSIGSGADKKTGWKHRTDIEGGSCARMWMGMPGRIIQASQRLLSAQIECMNAVDVIQKYSGPGMLIYADPPYVRDTRTASGDAYEYEMGNADHIELLKALNEHKGMVLLSGYDCPLYRDMLRGWKLETINTRAERASLRTECLWINPLAVERNAQMRMEDLL